jgi:hypothetical protein
MIWWVNVIAAARTLIEFGALLGRSLHSAIHPVTHTSDMSLTTLGVSDPLDLKKIYESESSKRIHSLAESLGARSS